MKQPKQKSMELKYIWSDEEKKNHFLTCLLCLYLILTLIIFVSIIWCHMVAIKNLHEKDEQPN